MSQSWRAEEGFTQCRPVKQTNIDKPNNRGEQEHYDSERLQAISSRHTHLHLGAF
jgi:hypothetical protein